MLKIIVLLVLSLQFGWSRSVYGYGLSTSPLFFPLMRKLHWYDNGDYLSPFAPLYYVFSAIMSYLLVFVLFPSRYANLPDDSLWLYFFSLFSLLHVF